MRMSDWSSDVCSSDLERALVAPREDILHRAEIARLDVDRAGLFARLCLGHPDRTDRRMAEHRARHVDIIDDSRPAAEDAVGKGLPFADRDGGKLDAIGDVADRVDARHR